MRGALLPAVVLAAGCYEPAIPSGVRCSPRGECPGDEACVAGICGGVEDVPEDPDGNTVIVGAKKSQLRDTEISGYDPDAVLGEDDHFSVDELEVSLLWFELPPLPAGRELVKATLRLRTAADADEEGGSVRVFRMRESWDEGAATWFKRTPTQTWSAVGAAPPSRDEMPITVLRPDRTFTPFELALPVELVRGWIADPASNFGIAFVRGSSMQHVHIASRESEQWSTLTLELAP
jgi:hypothetical protein